MTDKEEIKFAIRYLKKGLKSKRTPPLYEELMNELGFVRVQTPSRSICKLVDLTSEYYELENSNEKEIAELKAYNEKLLDGDIEKHNKIVELKELVEKYRQAVDKCLHITFMGGGCEVNTIGQYATLVDGYLTDVEGLDKWKN